jgi:hypothetical protein
LWGTSLVISVFIVPIFSHFHVSLRLVWRHPSVIHYAEGGQAVLVSMNATYGMQFPDVPGVGSGDLALSGLISPVPHTCVVSSLGSSLAYQVVQPPKALLVVRPRRHCIVSLACGMLPPINLNFRQRLMTAWPSSYNRLSTLPPVPNRKFHQLAWTVYKFYFQ